MLLILRSLVPHQPLTSLFTSVDTPLYTCETILTTVGFWLLEDMQRCINKGCRIWCWLGMVLSTGMLRTLMSLGKIGFNTIMRQWIPNCILDGSSNPWSNRLRNKTCYNIIRAKRTGQFGKYRLANVRSAKLAYFRKRSKEVWMAVKFPTKKTRAHPWSVNCNNRKWESRSDKSHQPLTPEVCWRVTTTAYLCTIEEVFDLVSLDVSESDGLSPRMLPQGSVLLF